MMQVFCKKPSIVASFHRMISITKYSINEINIQQNTKDDKKTENKTLHQDTHKSKCVDEKQNKKDKQSSNVVKAVEKMNENLD